MAFLDLSIERPVAGGRMLARHEGVVVLVSGAIPGERVRARVERSTRSLVWAETVEVLEPSAARRPSRPDPRCGGMDYAHIAYPRQLRLKGEVIADAFRRIGKVAIDEAIPVEGSPECGYRLRARLHVQGRRAGFLREGTHELCDAAATEQLLPDTVAAINATLSNFGTGGDDITAILVAENVAASERVLCVEARGRAPRAAADFGDAPVTGLTALVRGRERVVFGSGWVTDTAADLFGDAPPVPADTRWMRRPTSFFQANRFLSGALARSVMDLTPGDRCADLYAGVGLFAVALAARGAHVVAVEGDQASAGDLDANAARWSRHLSVIRGSVEDVAPRLAGGWFDAVALDPPRTGVSPRAMEAIVRLRAPRLAYVSCDPATLARDAARLLAAGYDIASIHGFDLFPNTGHVETVVAFVRDDRRRARPEAMSSGTLTPLTGGDHMATQDTCCTFVPYFKVREGQLEAFRALCERFVAKTRDEPKCLFYGFTFDGDAAHCREGYVDADGILAHLENIEPIFAEALKIADVTRLEVHGPADQLQKLKQPLADLKPQFFTLEYGFRR